MRAEFRKELENQQKVLVLAWAGFMVTLISYLWIPQLLLKQAQSLGEFPHSGTIRQFLWVFVFLEMAFLVWWKQRFLTRKALLQSSVKATSLLNVVKCSQSPAEEGAARIITNYLVGKIVGFAVAGSIAIYGLVLACIGGYFWDQYILSLIYLVLLLYLYPSKSFFVELMGELGRG